MIAMAMSDKSEVNIEGSEIASDKDISPLAPTIQCDYFVVVSFK
jgi:hypothetical protein